MNTTTLHRVIFALLVHLFLHGKLEAQNVPEPPAYEIKELESAVLGEKRELYIYKPQGYKPENTYPVLYVLDAESQVKMIAGQVQYLSESYKIIPQMIIVGIRNTNRLKDFTPSKSNIGQDGRPDPSEILKTSGGGEQFLRFFEQELFPLIERSYATAPFRILAGHSLGGLLGIQCLMTHPEYFKGYIAMSPSLQWDNEFLLKKAKGQWETKLPAKTFLYFCDATEGPAFHANQLAFDSLLKARKADNLRFTYTNYGNETHISVPVKAFYDGIRFVFPQWYMAINDPWFRRNLRSADIIKHYTQLTATYGYEIKPTERELEPLIRLLGAYPEKKEDIREVLQWNVSNNPESPTAFEHLGDYWAGEGRTAEAIGAYKKALELNGNDITLKKRLEALLQKSAGK